MKYEWGENKRVANLAKHGVDFIDAENICLISLRKANKREREYYEKKT